MLFHDVHSQIGNYSEPAKRLLEEIHGYQGIRSLEIEATLAAFTDYLDCAFPKESGINRERKPSPRPGLRFAR